MLWKSDSFKKCAFLARAAIEDHLGVRLCIWPVPTQHCWCQCISLQLSLHITMIWRGQGCGVKSPPGVRVFLFVSVILKYTISMSHNKSQSQNLSLILGPELESRFFVSVGVWSPKFSNPGIASPTKNKDSTSVDEARGYVTACCTWLYLASAVRRSHCTDSSKCKVLQATPLHCM